MLSGSLQKRARSTGNSGDDTKNTSWKQKVSPESSISRIDDFTDRILGLLENPLRDGEWDRRGMVVGQVQSGKTSNYTGLICKSADAGYKLIIVLARNAQKSQKSDPDPP